MKVLDLAREVIDEAALADVGVDEKAFLIWCGTFFHQFLIDRGVDQPLAGKLAPKFVAAIAARRFEIGLATTTRKVQ